MDVRAEVAVGDGVVRAALGDLTTTAVDVVVNAANDGLQHGAGLAGALAAAGGPVIQRESDAWVREHGTLAAGAAAITTSGELPCGHLVHVAGPVHAADRDNAIHLAAAVRGALDAADHLGASTVAMPAISTGIFGYPFAEAAEVIAETSAAWLAEGRRGVTEVTLVGVDEAGARALARSVEALGS